MKRKGWAWGVVWGSFVLAGCGTAGELAKPPPDSAPAGAEDAGSITDELYAAAGQSVSAGSTHTCVITVGGSVKCVGNGGAWLGYGDLNDRGLDYTTLGNNLSFLQLGVGKIVKGIYAGGAATCALLTTNQVKCWGNNVSGLLGLGDTVSRGDAPGQMGDSLPMLDLGTGRTAKMVAVGSQHMCVLLDTNQIRCWGGNTYGQLGQGDTLARGDTAGEVGDFLPVVHLGTGRSATAVAAGGDTTCALLDNGSVKCWGRNDRGQLGQGDVVNRGDEPNEMLSLDSIDLGTGVVAKAIGVGASHACALTTTNQVKCWGANSEGQLGVGDTTNRGAAAGQMGDALPFINLGTKPTVKALAVGAIHTCVQLDLNETITGQITTNQVKCWGANYNGRLGLGDTVARGVSPSQMGVNLPLVALGTGRSVRAISAGGMQTCAVLDNNRVKCWGGDLDGELGCNPATGHGANPGEMGDQLLYFELGSRAALAIYNGEHHVCARLATGELKCWGSGASGATGRGDTLDWGGAPKQMGGRLPVVSLGTARTVITASLGQNNSCAILNGGDVKCWGDNADGNLGQGDTVTRGDGPGEMGDALPKINLGTGKLAKAIGVGQSLICAQLTTNEMKCWGMGGDLGLGNMTQHGATAASMGDGLPAIDFGTRVVKSFAVGAAHVCAIFTTNELGCWGSNFHGELGIDSTATRGDGPNEMGANMLMVNLGTGRTAKAVATGNSHTCAILDNNQLKCWGANSRGQLGIGNRTNQGDATNEMGDNLPYVNLGTGRTAKSVVAGDDWTCAVLDTNQIKCWGDGFLGNLGRGNTDDYGGNPWEMGDDLSTIFLGTGRTVSALSAGFFSGQVCAVLDSGEAKCWGDNDAGALGQQNFIFYGREPGDLGDNLKPIDLGFEPTQ
jgi:alpha-tubulin suppressor-like RCC1 family protein